MLGIAAEHETYISPGQSGRDIGDTFSQEAVVTQVRVRVKRDWGEEYDDRLAQRVRNLDGNVKGRIIHSPLRPLHPVDDARAIAIGRSSPPDRDPGVIREFGKTIHSGTAFSGNVNLANLQCDAGFVFRDGEILEDPSRATCCANIDLEFS